ncbi:MAG: Gfo/Idh/MocA family oxidoreductase [Thermodesulfovibrionales bacterium]
MGLKAGVVGAGYLGRHHARIYSGLDGVELAAVVDLDAGRAEEVAGQYGGKAYADYRDVLGKLDAVSVVTPTETHFQVAMDFLSAGADVLVEKPMTSTVAEADGLIDEARRRGAVLQVGHLERYNPAVAAAAGLLESPVLFEAERISPFLERAAGVDVTMDLMIHDIDVIMSLLEGSGRSPRVRGLKAAGTRVVSGKIDVAMAWIEFEGGVTAALYANRISKERRRALRIYQKERHLAVDYQSKELEIFYGNSGGLVSEPVPVKDREPLKEELVDFIDCVRGRKCPRVSGQEGRDALEAALQVTEMIYRTAQ